MTQSYRCGPEKDLKPDCGVARESSVTSFRIEVSKDFEVKLIERIADLPWQKYHAMFNVIGGVISVLGALLFLVSLMVWGNYVRPWLASQIVVEMQQQDNAEWFGKQFYAYLEKSEPKLLDLLQSSEELRPVFQAHLDQAPKMAEIEKFVTEQVDAVFVLDLYDKRKLQIFDETEGARFVEVSQLSSQFYATKDQIIRMNVRPSYGSDWIEAIRSGENNITLDIGTKPIRVGEHGIEDDITCEVRRQLHYRGEGMINVRAGPENGKFLEDGFQIGVTVVAAKGVKDCQT